jgi:hypothetical protein
MRHARERCSSGKCAAPLGAQVVKECSRLGIVVALRMRYRPVTRGADLCGRGGAHYLSQNGGGSIPSARK